ncbi:MAG: tyrosine--tRNA ligase [Vigna little leaf phytoplasma]|nr:tyrosine--tRNA ligase [Vigna little leaf phytoplasma]
MSLFEELKWRNLIQDCSNKDKLRTLLETEQINFYCGFDPTAPSLTIGHLVQIITILLLYKKKHKPFILIGGGTGFIGDPKENAERTLLSSENILYNARQLKKQFQKLLSKKDIQFIDNYQWISKINLISFFRDYGKLFNVNYMLNKEKIAQRLNKGISYTEFSYMILQALDFYQLYKKYNIRLQIGGSDQWGNITSGLELIRKLDTISNQQKVIGMSIPLLLDHQGKKFGKSEKQTLWLDPNLTNPYELYQYFFNTKDQDVINYLKKLTLLEIEEIEKFEQEKKQNPKKRLAQKALANFIVSFLNSKSIAYECEQINHILFNKPMSQITENDFILLQKHLPLINIKKTSNPILLVDALKNTKLSNSKNEARYLINSKSIKVGGKLVEQVNYYLNIEDANFRKYLLLTKKNKFHALVYWE